MATEIGTKGKIVQVLGAVVDVEFPQDQLPEIYNEVRTRPSGLDHDLILEVEQHLGNNWVRALTLADTDGLRRGAAAVGQAPDHAGQLCPEETRGNPARRQGLFLLGRKPLRFRTEKFC